MKKIRNLLTPSDKKIAIGSVVLTLLGIIFILLETDDIMIQVAFALLGISCLVIALLVITVLPDDTVIVEKPKVSTIKPHKKNTQFTQVMKMMED